MKKNTMPIRELSETALFAAVLAVLSQIAIPLPNGVPLTLQTFAVALAGYYLGPKKGAGAVGVYVLLGAVGLPVFANFKAGFAAILGVTGGFIWGFVFLALSAGIGRGKRPAPALLLGLLGLMLCHGLGALQFSLLSGNPYGASLAMVSIPFIPKDVLSILAGYFFARLLARRRPSA